MTVSVVIKVFAALIVLVLLAAVLMLCSRTRRLTWGFMRRIFSERAWFKFWLLIPSLLFAVAFVVCYDYADKRSASALVTLNYSEASNGLNANKTRFNMSEIIGREVLERAIEKGALTGVTADDLAKCLQVAPTVQGNSYVESQYHIATEFQVDYLADEKTKHLDSDQVLQLILSAYKELYIEKYIDDFDQLDIRIDSAQDFAGMDYLDAAAYLMDKTKVVENYMYSYDGNSSSFVSSNGDTFNSLAAKCRDLETVQIEQNLEAYLIHNGISKDVTEYIGRLTYDNNLNEYDRRRAEAAFQVRNQAVSIYAEEMTRVVLVPTWDDTGEYYMGRTKVGIDELSVEAKEYSDQAAEIAKQMETNRATIASMESGVGSGENPAAEKLIREISESLMQLAKSAKTAAQEYMETQMNQCIASSLLPHSLRERYLICAGFLAASFAVLNFFSFSSVIIKKNNQYMKAAGLANRGADR